MISRWRSLRIPLGLFVFGVLIRLPFGSQYLYHWDSVNFALALGHYDVRLHQPHPPGYFLYVMMGKLVQMIVGEANASLVWLSVIASALGAVALYWLGVVMFDRRTAVVAGLLALTSPLVCFYGEVALSYSLEFGLVVLCAGLCYLQWSGKAHVWPWSALVLGIAGGVRQNTLLFLSLLWLGSLQPLRWRQRLGSVALLTASVLAWLVPMVMLSGGPLGYWEALRGGGMSVALESSFLDPTQLALNGARMALYIGYGLVLGIIPLIWGAWQAMARFRSLMRDRRAWTLALWIAPAGFFYLIVHLRQHGHIFTFLPALLLLVALCVVRIGSPFRSPKRRDVLATGLVAVITVANLAFFLWIPANLGGGQRLPLMTPSWSRIHQHDVSLHDRLEYVRAHFSPATTVILSSGFDFRHPDYYLADYRRIRYDGDTLSMPVTLSDDVQTVVLLGDGLNVGEGANAVSFANGEQMFFFDRKSDQQLFLDGVCVSLRSVSQ